MLDTLNTLAIIFGPFICLAVGYVIGHCDGVYEATLKGKQP